MTQSTLQHMYENHHKTARGEGFSILKNDRGQLFKTCIGTGKSVLDIGCRDGALTSFFREGNDVLGVDIDEMSLKKAEELLGIETMFLDLHSDWPQISNRTFDAIVAGEVLEHVYYPDKIAKKVSDHLREGGLFIGSVPNAFSLINRLRYVFARKKHTPLSDPTHINHFSAYELKRMLKHNFDTVHIVGLGRLGFLARTFPQWFAFDLCFVAKK